MNKNNDLPKNLKITNGKLTTVDGQSLTKYLRKVQKQFPETFRDSVIVNLVPNAFYEENCNNAEAYAAVRKAGSLSCSFCVRSQEYVRYLIQGKFGGICDECIEICNEIIEEKTKEAAKEILENE